MVFDRASIDNTDLLVALRLAYIREDSGMLSPEDEAAVRRDLPGYFERHLNRDLIAFVARREDGEPVACAFLLIVEKPMSPKFINGRTGTVMNVYTRPECRGRGYARRLMGMLLEEAADRGLCVVELKATDMGYGLYRSMGFEDDVSRYHRMVWTCGR